MNIVAMLVFLGVIFCVLIIWQVVVDRDSSTKALSKIAELTAAILFWGVIIALVIASIVYGR